MRRLDESDSVRLPPMLKEQEVLSGRLVRLRPLLIPNGMSWRTTGGVLWCREVKKVVAVEETSNVSRNLPLGTSFMNVALGQAPLV